MKNTLLIVAGIVILYLLFVNKKAKDTVRAIAAGVIPDVLTTNSGAVSGSTVLQSDPQPTPVVVVNGGSSPQESLLNSYQTDPAQGAQMVML